MAAEQTKKALSYVNQLTARVGLQDVALGGDSLTIPQVYATCNKTTGNSSIYITESAAQAMDDNHAFLQKKLSEGLIIYGINTGYGGSADVRPTDLREVQVKLISHLNAGFGDVFSQELTRGVMLARANSLCKAYSGARPVVVTTLLEMIMKDVIPQVPKRGSISASGDLIPTSYIAAAMMAQADSEVWLNGQSCRAPDALLQANIQAITFEAKEALAVVNASSFASTLAACVLMETNVAFLLTQVACGLSMEALRGSIETFSPILHSCMPHGGQCEVAANIRDLLNESQMVQQQFEANMQDDEGHLKLKQDRYSIRSIPQWLSPVLEILQAADKKILVELNSANDNPIIDHRTETIIHGANFQGISITVSMDQTRQAIQLCGKILFAQMSEIVNVQMSNGLPPNLSGCDHVKDYGYKGTDIAMASYMSELDYLTNAMTNHVLSAEMNNQSVNSLALISARYTQEALGILNMMLANILCAQLQAINLRWMHSRAERELDVIFKKHGMNNSSLLRKALPWYDFAFRPTEMVNALLAESGKVGNNREAFKDDVCTSMTSLVNKMKMVETSSEIASTLGTGTRKMYIFMKQTLGIPFHEGNVTLGKELDKIHKFITGRDVYGVILDCFADDLGK